MRSVESNFNSDSGRVGALFMHGVRHMWTMSMMNDDNKKNFKQEEVEINSHALTGDDGWLVGNQMPCQVVIC